MNLNFISFFLAFFLVYFVVNLYVFIKARQTLDNWPRVKSIFSFVFWFFPFSFIVGRVLEKFFLNYVTTFLIWAGYLWLALITYLTLTLILLDCLRWILPWFKVKPFWRNWGSCFKLKFGFGILAFCVLIVVIGFFNALDPKLKSLEIIVNKTKQVPTQAVTMLVASDIHFGTIIGNQRFQKFIQTYQKLQPDLVIFVGDTIDSNLATVIKEDVGQSLKLIKPKLGFYGVDGNHEHIENVENNVNYLTRQGQRILRDEVILIDQRFYLAGREDKIVQSRGQGRKSVNDLLKNVNPKYPLILLDHQPFNLKEVANTHKVDLQLSGHTHQGQFWPFNYIISMMYEIPYGYGKIDQTQFYITSGYGTWGPPIRIGSRSEMVLITLRF